MTGVLISKVSKNPTYGDLFRNDRSSKVSVLNRIVILLSIFFTVMYLLWRILYSLPLKKGIVPIVAGASLLAVEILGFIESLIMYEDLVNMRSYEVPKIDDDEYPDVDIFIATYNEDEDLLFRTVNGCRHLDYPDRSKVHIWLCDDNRRPQIRKLAKKMKVGYFDRADNEGAKAGNLNHAMSLTSSPYVVTLDADMIPRSCFLMKTIPYFVDAEKRNRQNGGTPVRLGLLQTPQSFYDPDVFQYALYSENNAPNEQDFFYRTIEVAKTSTNSVIYGGSNTVISREALEAIGGFYTGSITEDFATGMLIESAGFVSLALPEPLASGMVPKTYQEHIKQRTRWGRGVISTARQLHIFTRKGLSLRQKLSYWSSVVYWYSPIKNLIYMISPLLYAVFNIPVLICSWSELFVFWLPMFIMQDLTLRLVSRGSISTKWSGIYETSVMPHLLVPIVKELFGVTLSRFKVTDKSQKRIKQKRDMRSMMPFLILLAAHILGFCRIIWLLSREPSIGLVSILFWMVRNCYFIIMSIFLIDGREIEKETVKVKGFEPVRVTEESSETYDGLTTLMTEHSMKLFLDDAQTLETGEKATVHIDTGKYEAELLCIVTDVILLSNSDQQIHKLEIIDYNGCYEEYLQILYDRIPTLPQSLQRDFGILRHFWRNIAFRIARSEK
ncbi:MAG: glycosyltransferase [Erysipelotrichaceae bacterium]|nr:glycosyltransferase [Erysipelotrichaceae bacterium]